MNSDAVNTYGSSFFEEDIATLLNECSKLFRVKQRVTLLMNKEKVSTKRWRQETLDAVREMSRNYGMRIGSSSHTAQAQELNNVIVVEDHPILEILVIHMLLWRHILLRMIHRKQPINILKINIRRIPVTIQKNIMRISKIMEKKTKMKMKETNMKREIMENMMKTRRRKTRKTNHQKNPLEKKKMKKRKIKKKTRNKHTLEEVKKNSPRPHSYQSHLENHLEVLLRIY